MTIDDEVVAYVKAHVGEELVQSLGEVTDLLIRRFARTIGDENPLYFDDAVAREHGYPGIIAPPNLVVAIVDWTPGGKESDLRVDGTEDELAIGVPPSGVRLMGAGMQMEIVAPIFAGDQITLRSVLESFEERQTSTGRMLVVTYRNTYEAKGRGVVMICHRPILLR